MEAEGSMAIALKSAMRARSEQASRGGKLSPGRVREMLVEFLKTKDSYAALGRRYGVRASTVRYHVLRAVRLAEGRQAVGGGQE